MNKENFLKILLVLVILLLAVNFFQGLGLFNPEAAAGAAQKIGYRGNGVSVACSDNGQYVYAAGSGKLLRSTEFGKPGTWEIVVED